MKRELFETVVQLMGEYQEFCLEGLRETVEDALEDSKQHHPESIPEIQAELDDIKELEKSLK